MAKESQSIFRRLTQLFRSGPVVKRKVKDLNTDNRSSSAFELFRKTQSHVYSTAMSAYGSYDRMARYSDFSEMEYTPEISSAVDIYAEESVASDEQGTVLHIYSENSTVKKLLEELFYDTLNVEFNLTSWVRNLCKYGDFFLFNDVSPEHGVISAYPMPVNEVEREEGFDPEDPLAVRFRWVTHGNQVLENWQVSHMRLLGNDAFLPYGSSVLEPARRIWRQLILVEDAMLVYRVVRSPERRVFYIDVGNVPPEEIPGYMEQVQTSLKKSQVVDRDTGRVDLRYNPLSVDEDYYLPVRGTESGTKIDTLAGGQNATAIEDVEYIQSKLFAALKVPKAYLGYDEGLGAKATLSQEDIRFSRTISKIQRTVISELNKIAIIHLFCNGFQGEDLLDFELRLSNPSTIAQQQKLELFRSRFEIAGTATQVEGLVDREWIRKNLFNMNSEEIEGIIRGIFADRKLDLEVEAVKLPGTDEADLEIGAEEMPETEGEPMTAARNRNKSGLEMIDDIPDPDPDLNFKSLSINDENAPIKAQNTVNLISEVSSIDILSDKDDIEESEEEDSISLEVKKKKKFKPKDRSRRRRSDVRGKSVDHLRMVSHDRKNQSDSIAHPFGNKYDINSDLRQIQSAAKLPKLSENEGDFINSFLDEKISQSAKMTHQIKSTLKSLESKISNPRIIISESDNSSEEE